MFFNKNLDHIRIEESELLINVNFNNQKKIPIKEIKKVYVSVKKIPFHYELAYILFGGIFIGLNFGFLSNWNVFLDCMWFVFTWRICIT